MAISIPRHVETLNPYVPGKPIEETEREYGVTGAIKLASNENPLGPSPLAIKAVAENLGKLHLYPDAASFYLKKKMATLLGVASEELVLGNGSNELIELLVRTLMDGEDEAIISRGSFAMYKVALHAHNRRYIEVPARDFFYDLEAIAAAMTPRTKLIFLANPDNPAGTWFGKAPFEHFLEDVKRRNPDTLVVMDEAYFEYVEAEDYPDSLRYRRQYPNIVTLRTFSKIYGLAGLRLGYGILDARLANYLERVRMPFNVSAAAQAGAMAALEDKAHIERSRKVNREGLAMLIPAIESMGARVVPTQTNFVFIDLKRPAAPVNEALLRKGIIVRPVGNYGFPNALRITVGTAAENDALLAALRSALASPT